MTAYLDHAASTPMRPEALDAMLPYLRDHYGNPSGAHTMARDARKAIDEARDAMADVLGAQPGEVIFTSGGTESDNLAVLGVHDRRGGTVVCSAVEHHAVLDAVRARGGQTVAVDARGLVDGDGLARTLVDAGGDRGPVTLVSLMAVNNEVGIVQPLDVLVKVVREHAPNATVHTDAVQAVQWLDVAAATRDADLVSVSAHKFGGPKGVGALVVRGGVELAPRQLGGGQERELRSGTQNVAGIVGMAAAARATVATRAETIERVAALRDRLLDGILETVPDVVETGAINRGRAVVGPADDRVDRVERVGRVDRVAGICHVLITGVESESLLFLLEKAEVYASAASSCASGAMEPSHVLAAMGVPRELAMGSLRLSLGSASTDADVDAALAAVPPAVERLRMFS